MSKRLGEFVKGLNSMERGRIRAIFDKQRRFDGRLAKLGEEIERRAAAGWIVERSRSGELRFTGPDGRFLDERAITQTGMRYARYLSRPTFACEHCGKPACGEFERYCESCEALPDRPAFGEPDTRPALNAKE